VDLNWAYTSCAPKSKSCLLCQFLCKSRPSADLGQKIYPFLSSWCINCHVNQPNIKCIFNLENHLLPVKDSLKITQKIAKELNFGPLFTFGRAPPPVEKSFSQ
jgi:hypothetical protein